jgi:hypothetical protein
MALLLFAGNVFSSCNFDLSTNIQETGHDYFITVKTGDTTERFIADYEGFGGYEINETNLGIIQSYDITDKFTHEKRTFSAGTQIEEQEIEEQKTPPAWLYQRQP